MTTPRRIPTPMPPADRSVLREVDPLPPKPPPREGHGDGRTTSALSFVAGVWLMLSPLIIGYDTADESWNPVVCGGAVAALALVRLAHATGSAWLRAWMGYVSALIGPWLIVSAFFLTDSAEAFWNQALLGVIVFSLELLGEAVHYAEDERVR